MPGFCTLDLTDDEAQVISLRRQGKSQDEVAAMLSMTKYRINHLMGRATRKVRAKERLAVQRKRKLRF